MQWVLLAVVLVVVFCFIILKQGRRDFWKIASRHPDRMFEMFQEQSCWQVFLEKPEGGYKNKLPFGEWDGPFKLVVPKLGGKMITVYGKVPEYQEAQQEFMDSIKGKS